LFYKNKKPGFKPGIICIVILYSEIVTTNKHAG